MGNNLVKVGEEDSPQTNDYEFYKTIHMHLVESAIKLMNNSQLDQESNIDETEITWKVFYSSLIEISELFKDENQSFLRQSWHPATLGFAMESEAVTVSVKTPDVVEQKDELPDHYTADSASESSIGSNLDAKNIPNEDLRVEDEKSSLIDNHLPQHQLHPVFFGYSRITEKDSNVARKQQQKLLKEREMRAITRAKQIRLDAISQMEQRIEAQRKLRQNNLDAIKTKYDTSAAKMKSDFERNSAGLKGDMRNVLQVWCFVTSTLASVLSNRSAFLKGGIHSKIFYE